MRKEKQEPFNVPEAERILELQSQPVHDEHFGQGNSFTRGSQVLEVFPSAVRMSFSVNEPTIVQHSTGWVDMRDSMGSLSLHDGGEVIYTSMTKNSPSLPDVVSETFRYSITLTGQPRPDYRQGGWVDFRDSVAGLQLSVNKGGDVFLANTLKRLPRRRAKAT